jgi:hypothetical protein
MKYSLIAGIIVLIFAGCNTLSNESGISRESLVKGFIIPPDSIQTSLYWYWIINYPIHAYMLHPIARYGY